MDSYQARIFISSDCNRKKYKAKTVPKDVNLRNTLWYICQFPWCKIHKLSRKYIKNPEKAKFVEKQITNECFAKVEEVRIRGLDKTKGLQQHFHDLMSLLLPSFEEDLAALFFTIFPVFDKIDKGRRQGKTEEIRRHCEALCGGYEGDPLMKQNIAMFKLAQSLPVSIWSEYDHSSFDKLAERIQDNIDGKKNDLPLEFLDKWKLFMKEFGYDGTPQLFISAPRYIENPALLLAMISHSSGDGITDPEKTMKERVAARREAMARDEARARKQWYNPWKLSKIQKRNEVLEHLLWIRNSPKMNIAAVMGMLREAVVATERELIRDGRIERPNDIFHLSLKEIDKAIMGDNIDLMELVRPRRERYENAKKATICPMVRPFG